jgi:hypothetical protein
MNNQTDFIEILKQLLSFFVIAIPLAIAAAYVIIGFCRWAEKFDR